MVATTRSRSPLPISTTRRGSMVDEPTLIENEIQHCRRHSIAVPFPVPIKAISELKSPRTLKDLEAELRLSKESSLAVHGSRPAERTKRSGSTIGGSHGLPRKLLLSTRPSSGAPYSSVDEPPLSEIEIVGTDHAHLQSTLSAIRDGFDARAGPVPVDDGTGGVYYLRTKARRIAAVFKPADEEPFAVNNPKDHHLSSRSNNSDDGDAVDSKQLTGIRGGISPGGAATREVAAYLLDHDHRAGVPLTALVSARHSAFFVRSKADATLPRKVGSLQLYVPHDCSADDIPESLISVERVHALAILDIRLANQDRHGGNLLAVESRERRRYDIVPIDHGACLPRITSMEETSFLWLAWPQAKVPFGPETKAYIASLNAIRDAELLLSKLPTAHQLELEALLTLVVSTTLLQVCVLKFNMTAYDTATLMCRHDSSEPSVLEQLIRLILTTEKHATTWSRSTAEHLKQALSVRLEAFLSDSRSH